jgi:protein-S-isoprenylcysteine O-methyltransferase Ste14
MTSLATRAFVVPRGLVYAAAFVSLWTWLALESRALDARLAWTLPAGLRAVGMVLAAAGALLVAWCVALFVTRGRGTPAPFDPPREFVVSGPYRTVRNPMYLGAFALLLGAGCALSSPGILLLALAFLVILHLFVVLIEEPGLAARFGDGYERYRATVGRWLPRRRGGVRGGETPP